MRKPSGKARRNLGHRVSPARRENSEPYGHGPVVIVSSDAFNASAIRTVLVAVVTSNLRLARAPGNFLVPADGGSGLRDDSVVNISQVLVVDKARLVTRRGMLDSESLFQKSARVH